MLPSTFCIPTINEIGRVCLVEKVTRVFLHNKIKSHLFTDAKLVSSLEIAKQSIDCYEQEQIDCIVSIGEGAVYTHAKAMIYLQSHQSIFISDNIKNHGL
ncbi:MAG: hypothetical protein ACL7BU_03730 [Candidatus Phlomobacter fragariae]